MALIFNISAKALHSQRNIRFLHVHLPSLPFRTLPTHFSTRFLHVQLQSLPSKTLPPHFSIRFLHAHPRPLSTRTLTLKSFSLQAVELERLSPSASFIPYVAPNPDQLSMFRPTYNSSNQSVISAPSISYTIKPPAQLHNLPNRMFDPTPYTNQFVGICITFNQLLGISTVLPAELTTLTDESFYNTLMIDTSFASRGESTNGSLLISSYGAFYGPSSQNNCCGLLPSSAHPPPDRPTSQNVEAYAAICALEALNSILAQYLNPTPPLTPYEKELKMFRENLSLVVIKTDSGALANDLNENIWYWLRSGFFDAKGGEDSGRVEESDDRVAGFGVWVGAEGGVGAGLGGG